MKNHLPVIAFTLLTITTVHAQSGGPNPASANLIFNDTSNSNVGVFNPGATFTLNVSLNYSGANPTGANGITYFLESVNSGGNSATGIFTITGRTLATFTDPQTTSFPASDPINGNNGNSSDLGASGGAQSQGIFALGTLTIAISGSAPAGSYTLSNLTTFENFGKGAVLFGSDGSGFDLPSSSYSVQIIPEPATWSMLVLGGMSCAGARFFRRGRQRQS